MEDDVRISELLKKYDEVIVNHFNALTTPYRDFFLCSHLFRLLYGTDATHKYGVVFDVPKGRHTVMEYTFNGGVDGVGRYNSICEKSKISNNNDKDENGVYESEFNVDGNTFYPFFETCRTLGVQRFPLMDGYLFVGVVLRPEYMIVVESDDSVEYTVPYINHIDIYSLAPIDTKRLNDEIVGKIERRCVRPDVKKNQISLVIKTQHGLSTVKTSFSEWNGDISKNYNDDVPYEKVRSIVTSDNPELILFYGKSGTGKSSFVKTLINSFVGRNVEFLYFTPDIFRNVEPTAITMFLSSHQNAVCILEDCEKLLLSREITDNGVDFFLNLTDGILGEAFSIKFICTFNTSIEKIDGALTRKGRLSLQYEFKELCLEKCKAINPNAHAPMTLADLYGMSEDNGTQEKKAIGFNIN